MATIRLETRYNRLFIYAPDNFTLNQFKRELTFKRPVQERVKGVVSIKYQFEPCYKSTSLPLTISCPIGFRESLIDTFASQYSFVLDETPSLVQADWVKANTVPDWSRISKDIVFRDNQKEILEIMCNSLRGRIVLPTGAGKSFMISRYVELMPNARIIITTYSNQVLLQLYENVRKVCFDIGILCSTTKTNIDARVVCASAGLVSTYLREGRDQDIDVLIVDEYHEWGSKARLELLDRVEYARMFGLSANKTRLDKAESRLNGIFGPLLAELQYSEAVEDNLVTPIWVVWVPVRSAIDPTKNFKTTVAKERHGIWQSEVRNTAIANVANMFGADEQVLISVSTIEHAMNLHTYLPDYTLVYAAGETSRLNSYMYVTDEGTEPLKPITHKRLKELKQQFTDGTLKKVIATGTWKRGVDFPELQVLIRADASSSKIDATQWAGRTSRKHADKTVGVVVDFTDEFIETYRVRALKRRKHYKDNNWKQMSLSELLNNPTN